MARKPARTKRRQTRPRRKRQVQVDGRQLVRDAIAVSFAPPWKQEKLLRLLATDQLDAVGVTGLTDPRTARALVDDALEKLLPDPTRSPRLVVRSPRPDADGRLEWCEPPVAPADRIRSGDLLDAAEVASWGAALGLEMRSVPEQEIRSAAAAYVSWTPPEGLQRVRWGKVRHHLEHVAKNAEEIANELDSSKVETFQECVERDRASSMLRLWGMRWEPMPGEATLRQGVQTEIRQAVERLPLVAAAARLAAAECRLRENTGAVGDEGFVYFVAKLGRVFEKCTGRQPSAGYDPASESYGDFAHFVSTVMASLHRVLGDEARPGKSPYAGADRPHFGKAVQRALTRHKLGGPDAEAAVEAFLRAGSCSSDTMEPE